MKPIIRCSGLDRLLNCNGSRTLLDAIAKNSVDLFDVAAGDAMTWRGNWCHYDSALRLIMDHGAIGEPGFPELPPGYEPSDWDKRTSEWFVSNVLDLTPDDHAIYVETRVTMEFEHFILSGQLDVHTISPDETEFTIDDDKTGPNVVDHAEENWQLTGYAVLLKHKHPKLQRGKIRILQKEAPEQITEAVVDTMEGLTAYLEGQINEALRNAYLLNSGYKQCRLCEAVFIPCPAVLKEFEAMKLLLTPEYVEKMLLVPDIQELAEVCARGRAIAGPIEKLLKRLKERLIGAKAVTLKDGTVVSVAEELGPRAITNSKVAHELAKEKISDEESWKTMSMSLGLLEDALCATGMMRKSKNPEKETATSWIKFRFAHIIVRKPQKQLVFK